jgi:monoamine oxidase
MPAMAVELVPVSDGAHGWAGFIDGPIESGLRAARRLAAEGTAGRAG